MRSFGERTDGCLGKGDRIPSLTAIVALLRATVVRGATVFAAPSRPARLFSLLAFLSTATLPINLPLYEFQVLDILCRPEAISDCSNESRLGSFYFPRIYPSVYRRQADSSLLGSFGSRELPINHE